MDTLTRMRALVAVVEAGGYSAAGRKIGRSKALLSKYVRELEDEVGALLLNRTTRQVSLTGAGEVYFARATELIREIDELRDAVGDQSGATGGTLRMSAPRAFSDAPIGMALVDFAAAHPDIALEVDLSDRFVDLVEEGFDLAIRITTLEDGGLIAKKLAPMRILTVASPELLASDGRPAEPMDMRERSIIVDTNARQPFQLRYKGGNGEAVTVPVMRRRIVANSPIMALRAACAGLGFAHVPDFIAQDALDAGRVETVLDEFVWDAAGIYALYPHRRHLTRRVRLLLDFLGAWFKRR